MPENGAREEAGPKRLMSPKAALSVANSVLGAILGTAALIFIAKDMGPNVLGILAYALASVGILSFLSDFGVGSVHVHFVKKGEDLAKCIGAYASIRLVLLVIFVVVTIPLIELWKRGYLGGSMEIDDALADSLYVFLIYYLLLGISQIATHTFDALDQSAKVLVPSILEVVVRVSFIIFIATSAYGTGPSGPALLASAYAAGMISSMLLVSFLMRNNNISRPGREILVKYIRSLAPVFVISMVLILDLYLDKVVVGYFWGGHEVGLYFGVQKMAIFVGVFSLSVATLILPSVTSYFAKKDSAATWDIVDQAERYVSLVVIPTAAFYLFYGRDILNVFLTSEFAGAVNTMNVLVISSTVLAFVLPLRSVIAGTGKPSILFWIGASGLGIQFALMLLFVPDSIYGFDTLGLRGLGAAIALLVGSIYYFFAFRYMVWKTSRILPTSRSFKHIVGALMMVGAMYLVDHFLLWGPIDWLALIALALVGFASYSVSVYLMGELEPSDYRSFRELLHPQDTLQYVVNELLGKRGH
jgi:O-antigen/teichoic acid export membrane protein